MKSLKMISIYFFLISLSIISPAFGAPALDGSSWIKSQMRVVSSIQSLESSSAVNELDQLVQDKRVLMLGESDHYVTEKLQYQLALIKRYYAKGFTAIGAEMGRSDARRINRFLQTGDERILDAVALFGNKSEILIERDLPKGLLAVPVDAETTATKKRWRQANIEFWREIRALNLTRKPNQKPLELFGFDIDVLPGGAYSDINGLLGKNNATEVRTLKSILIRPPGETRTEEIARLKQAQHYIESRQGTFAKLYRPESLKDIKDSLRQLIESFEFIDIAYNNPTHDQWMKTAEQREKTMMWQMDDRVSHPEKIILIGHNSHLSNNSTSLNLMNVASGEFTSMWFTIGTYLHQKLEKKIYTVWMLYGGGKRSTGPECPAAECSIEIKAGTINSQLLDASDNKFFLLNLKNGISPEFLKRPVDFQFNGDNINSSVLTDQCDSIFFVPFVHPTEMFQ